MNKHILKAVSMALVLALLAILWSGSIAWAEAERPLKGDLTLIADNNTVFSGGTVNLTAGFNLLESAVNSYSALRITVFLPAGLDYVSGVVYVGGAPAALTATPANTPAGTSVVVDLNDMAVLAGAAQLKIAAKVSNTWGGGKLSVRGGLYLQPTGASMPNSPNEEVVCTLESLNPVTPTVPPKIYTVRFNPSGGIRVGGGALIQAVAGGGSAIEPYVYRDGYILQGWDMPLNYITHDQVITAIWSPDTDNGMITVDPPSGSMVQGYFVHGQNEFTRFSHMPMIYYAEHYIARFESVEIGSRILRPGSEYVATAGTRAGTTAIHLKASYLNVLNAGSYTLRVNFRNGVYANSQLTVAPYRDHYTDVSKNDWFYKGVEAMTASELLRGVTGTRFDPYSSMSRGMMVTLLYRYVGEPSVAGFGNRFPDIAPGQYFTDAVMWAAANGIVNGYTNGLFAPYDMMTHEQFAAVLFRYQDNLGSIPTDVLPSFGYNDFNQINYYAQAAVNKLATQGVFRDWPPDRENRFRPQNPVTRAEVATVMRLWIESIGW